MNVGGKDRGGGRRGTNGKEEERRRGEEKIVGKRRCEDIRGENKRGKRWENIIERKRPEECEKEWGGQSEGRINHIALCLLLSEAVASIMAGF